MSDYMYWAEDSSEAIEHHGILGQKWGKRRYQYEDGSLTPAGRERYLSGIFNNIKNAGKASTNGYQNTINNITASQQSGRYRARSGRQGSMRKNDPQLSKEYLEEYGYNNESYDYDLNTTQPEKTETENTIKEEQHIYPNGSDNQSWYARFIYNNGKTSIKIVDKKYENSRKDTRNIVQKAADTYVSGWNTIKDTYVSGLKTIAGWFK